MPDRLAVARTLAWTLLLTGWIGLGSLAQTLASGVLAGFALMALWLLAAGVLAAVLERWRPSAAVGRGALVLVGLAAGAAVWTCTQGGGDLRVLGLLVAWAAALALASSAVRACRARTLRRPGPPIASGAAAAVLCCLVVGDPADPAALAARLALSLPIACAVLAMLWPRGAVSAAAPTLAILAISSHMTGGADRPASAPAAASGCRAALFDCALPAWPAREARSSSSAPMKLAALVMLPMMLGLPLMSNLCRGDGIAPRAMLALHLGAMFVPALLLSRQRAGTARYLAPWCAGLLIAGAALGGCLPGELGWTGLVLAQGAAWSLAWGARWTDPRPALARTGQAASAAPSPASAPSARAAVRSSSVTLNASVRGAALNALLALALGAAVDHGGLRGLLGWHLALGAAAGASLLASALGAALRSRGRALVGRVADQ